MNPRWDAVRGVERTREFRSRAIQALEQILARYEGHRVIVVTHGTVINAYLSMILDIPRDMFFLPAYASVSSVRSAGDLYALRALNDVSHLQTAV